jgi:hypothetical protein
MEPSSVLLYTWLTLRRKTLRKRFAYLCCLLVPLVRGRLSGNWMEDTLAGDPSGRDTIQKLLSLSMIWMPHSLSWVIVVYG